MKKIFCCLTLLISLFIFTNHVNASSFNVEFIGENKITNEITLELEVNNMQGFKGSCNGLCGLVGELSYDKEKLEVISIESLNNFELVNGNKIVLYKTTGVTDGTKLLSIKLKNKTLAKEESTIITLKNIVASDGDNDITTSDIKKEIRFTSKIEDAENKEESKKIFTNKKEDKKKLYLSSIKLSNGVINFSKEIFEYNIKVAYDIDNIEIKAEPEDKNATVEGVGKHELKVGNNKITVTVKDEDGNETKYTLNINRSEKKDDVKSIGKSSNKSIIIIPMIIVLLTIVAYTIYKKRNKI